NGDQETGVTIIKLDEELDHGPIVASKKLQVKSEKLYFEELHSKLAGLGAELLIKILTDYVSGKIKPKPQDHTKATFTKIITKDDGRIDWSKPAEFIERQVRAFHLWPVAWSTLNGKRIKIYKGQAQTSETKAKPGEIIEANKNLTVACGSGVLQITELQLEGAKKMTIGEFLRGQRILQQGSLLV
ncbi:methionyl-tRNA formyltransferase, partial [Candidatus Berkelbacteria bacterium]|nr:methionyl-tRNA formyltransferase [Candidatus Berkelbacteria bacterium]